MASDRLQARALASGTRSSAAAAAGLPDSLRVKENDLTLDRPPAQAAIPETPVLVETQANGNHKAASHHASISEDAIAVNLGEVKAVNGDHKADKAYYKKEKVSGGVSGVEERLGCPKYLFTARVDGRLGPPAELQVGRGHAAVLPEEVGVAGEP